jgi:hypothetical protein
MHEADNTNAIIRKFEPLLAGLSLYELTVLNKMAVDRIGLMQQANALLHMSKFNAGDQVSWNGKDGVARSGVIIRLNLKTVSIKMADGGQWNVSPHLLRKEN